MGDPVSSQDTNSQILFLGWQILLCSYAVSFLNDNRLASRTSLCDDLPFNCLFVDNSVPVEEFRALAHGGLCISSSIFDQIINAFQLLHPILGPGSASP